MSYDGSSVVTYAEFPLAGFCQALAGLRGESIMQGVSGPALRHHANAPTVVLVDGLAACMPSGAPAL